MELIRFRVHARGNNISVYENVLVQFILRTVFIIQRFVNVIFNFEKIIYIYIVNYFEAIEYRCLDLRLRINLWHIQDILIVELKFGRRILKRIMFKRIIQR